MAATPKTALCRYTADRIFLRDLDLVDEVIGRMDFTALFFYQVMARKPSPQENAVLNAVLVTLMEHGLTPSAIATRLIAVSSPEASQAAIAAGLLGVGSRFIGTIEDSARLLQELVAAPEGIDKAAADKVALYRAQKLPLPGFGHHLHKPDDPRSPVLLEFATSQGLAGEHIAALKAFSREIDRKYARHITINATGAVGAVLAGMGIPLQAIRGIAVLARAAGLVAHVLEEESDPAARYIWDLAEEHVEHTAAPGR